MIRVVLFLVATICTINLSGQNSAVSSHFVYDGKGLADIISMEVRVPADGIANYTYYEVLGWSGYAGGYAGIQQSIHGRNFIFSIWDNDRQRSPIQTVYKGHGTETETFGGEGTGLKSWNFEIPWATDTWYSINARCWPVGNHTYYGFWVRDGVNGEWKHLVTMDVDLDNLSFPNENDAFLEDWLDTGYNRREMHMRNSWRRTKYGNWVASQSGRHTVNDWDFADPSKRSYYYKDNWDAGISSDETGAYYYMITGGENTSNTLNNGTVFNLELKGDRPAYEQGEVLQLDASYTGFHLNITWDIVKTKLPQFSYRVKVYDNPNLNGEPVYTYENGSPHHRKLKTEFKMEPGTYYGQFALVDLFDNESLTYFSFDVEDKAYDIGLNDLFQANSYGCNTELLDLGLSVANYGAEALTSFKADIYIDGVYSITRNFSCHIPQYGSDEFVIQGITLPDGKVHSLQVSVEHPNGHTDPYDSDNMLAVEFKFKGETLETPNVKTLSYSSQYPGQGPENLLDADPATIWHNNWAYNATLPYSFVFDLGDVYSLTGLEMLNRQDNTNGRPQDAMIYIKEGGADWGPGYPVQFSATNDWQTVLFNEKHDVRYVRLIINSTISGSNVCSMAELRFLGCESVSTSLSDNNKQIEEGLSVYPNPADNHLMVDYVGSSPVVNVLLKDVTGKVVCSENSINGQKSGHLTINVADLSAGLYFLVINTLDGFRISKIIIQ